MRVCLGGGGAAEEVKSVAFVFVSRHFQKISGHFFRPQMLVNSLISM